VTKWQYWVGWLLAGVAFLTALFWVIRAAILSADTAIHRWR